MKKTLKFTKYQSKLRKDKLFSKRYVCFIFIGRFVCNYVVRSHFDVNLN